MEIKDSDGKIRTLRLWNDDVILFAKLRVGDEITISGAYEKMGFSILVILERFQFQRVHHLQILRT